MCATNGGGGISLLFAEDSSAQNKEHFTARVSTLPLQMLNTRYYFMYRLSLTEKVKVFSDS